MYSIVIFRLPELLAYQKTFCKFFSNTPNFLFVSLAKV